MSPDIGGEGSPGTPVASLLVSFPGRKKTSARLKGFRPGHRKLMLDGMNDEVIAHIRERMATVRKIIRMAHDPRMIEMLEAMLVQAEEDIRRLEAESAEAQLQQPARQADHGPTPQP